MRNRPKPAPMKRPTPRPPSKTAPKQPAYNRNAKGIMYRGSGG